MTSKRLLLAAILLALAQIGFLSWMIAGRAAILRDGKVVLLKVEPIDPRDLLRGDYVSLRYEISSIATSEIGNLPQDKGSTADGDIYVRVKKEGDGFWRTVSATLDAPLPAPPGADEADIKGHISAGWSLGDGASISPSYGIERFYLPEGEGLAIEQDMRERPFGMRVAVASDGTAQIKAFLDGDKVLFEEPLY